MDTEIARAAVVRLVLALRAEYLAAGANPLKHWEQLHERLRAAARTTGTAEEFATKLQRDLRIATVTSSFCSATTELVDAVGGEHAALLDLIDREHGYIMALARKAADEKRREAQAKRDVRAAVAAEEGEPWGA